MRPAEIAPGADACCLRSSQADCSCPPSSTATICGSLHSFSSRCIEWCAPRTAHPPPTRAVSRGARSHSHRSAVALTLLAVVERVPASPCSPNHPHSCAGRSGYAICNPIDRPAAAERCTKREERVANASADLSPRARVARDRAAVRSGPRSLRVLWAAPGGDPGRDRCVHVEARVMVCGTPHAAAVVTRAVPQRAIDGLPAGRRCGSQAATLASRCVVWDTPDRTVMCGLLVARPGGACACLNRSAAVIVRLYTSLNTKNGP